VDRTGSLFSYVNLEEQVPARHPLRKIKMVVDAALSPRCGFRAALCACCVGVTLFVSAHRNRTIA
jgi:hypothetical protein